MRGPLGELGHDCWTLFGHHVSHRLQALIGAAGVAALIIVLVRFASVSTTSLRSRRRDYGAHADLMRITELSNAGEPGVLWLDHPAPFAYSLRGRPPLVVASTGLRALPYAHQDAVMRHEVAHLRGRHHLLVALTQDLAAALPIVPLFRQAPPRCGSSSSWPPMRPRPAPAVAPPCEPRCSLSRVGRTPARRSPWPATMCHYGCDV